MEPAIRFGAVTPLIPVRDVAKSVAFYEEKLGFAELFRDGDPLAVAGMRRDDATILLTRCTAAAIVFEWTSFRLGVSGLAALYAQCRASGIVHPNGALADRPWGTREFAVLDPDAICITFWEVR